VDYRLVTHFGSGEVRHRLESERLVVEYDKSGQRDDVPYHDIAEINVRNEMQGVYSTRIVRKTGKNLTIPARHFKALGQFEDRSEEYVAFIDELHRAAHAANPAIRFVAGSSLLYWLGMLLVVFGVFFAGAFGYALLFSPKPPPRRIIPIIPIALLVGGMFVKQGRARPYAADQLPERLLPSRRARSAP
jgi:hypothetical protein